MADQPKTQKHLFNQEQDTACLAEWNRVLKLFKSVAEVDTLPKNFKDIIGKLKEQVTNNTHLNFRQVEAITARCNNFLAGKYGQTKTAAHLAHGKS